MKGDRIYLLDVLNCEGRILDYTRELRAYFFSDTKTQDAVIRNIEIIGKAIKSVSPKQKSAFPHVPWQQIARMRDRLIHHYFRVDLDLVWEVVERDLGGLKARIAEMLATLPTSPTQVEQNSSGGKPVP